MQLQPCQWAGEPAIAISCDAADLVALADRLPSPLDYLGRFVASIRFDRWRCAGAQVTGTQVIYVPAYTGFVRPVGDQLEQEMWGILRHLATVLHLTGLSITTTAQPTIVAALTEPVVTLVGDPWPAGIVEPQDNDMSNVSQLDQHPVRTPRIRKRRAG